MCIISLGSGRTWCSSILGLANLNGIKNQPFIQMEDVEAFLLPMEILSIVFEWIYFGEIPASLCFLKTLQLLNLIQVQYISIPVLFCIRSYISLSSIKPKSLPTVHEVIWLLSTCHVCSVHLSPEKGVCGAACNSPAHTTHPCHC